MDDNTKRIIFVALLVLAAAFECVLALMCGTLGGYVGARVALSRAEQVSAAPDVEAAPWQGGLPRGPMPEISRSWAALVLQVESNSPADAAGISPGDMIVAVNGASLTEDMTLREMVLEHRPGDRITLTISRGTRTWDTRVTLGSAPEGPEDVPWLGVRFQMVPRIAEEDQ